MARYLRCLDGRCFCIVMKSLERFSTVRMQSLSPVKNFSESVVTKAVHGPSTSLNLFVCVLVGWP